MYVDSDEILERNGAEYVPELKQHTQNACMLLGFFKCQNILHYSQTSAGSPGSGSFENIMLERAP